MLSTSLPRIVDVAEMRALEEAVFARGISPAELMETAGLAVARAIRRWLPSLADQTVLYLIGSGNNGGDGLIAARALLPHVRSTRIYLVRDRGFDPLIYEVKDAGAAVLSANNDADLGRIAAWLQDATVVVDAILGIGSQPPVRAPARDVLAVVQRSRLALPVKTIALDVPTGIDSDTGEADPLAFVADVTICTGPVKIGLYLHPAASLAGSVLETDLELPTEVLDAVPGRTVLASGPLLAAHLPPRPVSSHKGTFGKTLIVGGSAQYTGAPGLSARAAGRVGAGLVTLGLAASIQPIVGANLLNATYIPLPADSNGCLGTQALGSLISQADDYDAVLIGPGMGRTSGVEQFVLGALRALVTARHPWCHVVVDADAINALAQTDIWNDLAPGHCILTPHLGEMSRLLGISVDAVEQQRVGLARDAAQRWQQTVVLKGTPTVVASRDGLVTVFNFSNPALATAGTGDVLAGIIVGLLAQGLALDAAAQLGVWLHGVAGERLRMQLGNAGAVASDLLPHLALAIRSVRDSLEPSLSR